MNTTDCVIVTVVKLIFLTICFLAVTISTGNDVEEETSINTNDHAIGESIKSESINSVETKEISPSSASYRTNGDRNCMLSCHDCDKFKMATIKLASALVAGGQHDGVILTAISTTDANVFVTLMTGIVKNAFRKTLSNAPRIIQFLSNSDIPCSVYIPGILTLYNELNGNVYANSMEILLLVNSLKEDCKAVDEMGILINITAQSFSKVSEIFDSFVEKIRVIITLPNALADGRVHQLFSESVNMTQYIPELVTRGYPRNPNKNITWILSTFSFIDYLPFTYQKIIAYNALVDLMKASDELRSNESMLLAFYVSNAMKNSIHEFDYNYNNPRNVFTGVFDRFPLQFRTLFWPGEKFVINNVQYNKVLVPFGNYSTDIPSTPVFLTSNVIGKNMSEFGYRELSIETGHLITEIKMGSDGMHNYYNLCARKDGEDDSVKACTPPDTWIWQYDVTWHIEPILITRDKGDDRNPEKMVFTISSWNREGGRYYLFAKEDFKAGHLRNDQSESQFKISTRSNEDHNNMTDIYWTFVCQD